MRRKILSTLAELIVVMAIVGVLMVLRDMKVISNTVTYTIFGIFMVIYAVYLIKNRKNG